MEESSIKLHSLEDSLKFAKDAYIKAAKVAGGHGEAMPMSLEAWLNQARERHAVLSNMDDTQREIALHEDRQEQLPALLATRDFLNQFIDALEGGKGKKFAKNIVKKAKQVERDAKKVMRQQRG
jgi:hypothetical protein